MFFIIFLPLLCLAFEDNLLFKATQKKQFISPTTSTVNPISRIDYPLKVCAMINCAKREILNTNCDFTTGRGRLGCYNIEENKCTPLPSRKFCFRSMNKNMAFVKVNKTNTNPTEFTLYTFKDPLCQIPDHYDKPFTAQCDKHNIISGKLGCKGENSPLGMMCRSKDYIFNTQNRVHINQRTKSQTTITSIVSFLLFIAFLL
ncbi:hypothetical protein EHI8A_042190 [Entamoeba histolytica HM-1:IMSS-B]|uniref:Uncharacterized protein n=6 Tax=Entamoeba histolytica TaxID=5759 RepID=C4LZH8_ENTH1|nr:hypothetical protein EHI_124420 [Entamoeba histolytica HM-1:IMSS]EMD42547.1 Hypothetical protein EHI5A_030670 [Entamoeba histolytica KU27]EMH72108.1 hypothetical protein EHI8A_042190 [Entamoeba histolytica HM-1:IMSS-B]EMS16045.1 hypothetical protein KM1_037560 [Entamoeba histolytica HM-3:IMSS]ENY63633.1 hypothetical protein EHI7A_043450 [Entamoeba histolytica HM-1:IMSS-A]GAT94272.1 hypothetical protein CL6EHI_124420 [Entamoeba histolytica]|eukprot:XP_654850.1 hypothetical protein EHI_124420 [Entamoeba histolytica HM-1:IMSS]